jgi:Dolichyl-phosphate-mannose-protein mannosyltransferase
MPTSIDDKKASRFLPWLCALLVVAAVLAGQPFGDVAFGDDWSYAVTANALAQTGHFRYTGWSTPSVGVDAYWAALLIRIFGFSYQVVRLSSVPFAAGCALLLFALGKRFGLSPVYCAFGTLALMLSPVMIPLGACFLTDVPGLFFLLLTFYAEVRCLQSENQKHSIGWLVLAAVATALGGTIRQLVFFGGFAGLPAIALFRRRERFVGASAAILWVALAAWMVTFIHWFTIQPNTETTPMSTLAHDWVHIPSWSLYSLFIFLFTGAEFALPVALLALSAFKKPRYLFWIGLAVFTVTSLLCLHHIQHDWNVVPFGNLLSYFGLDEKNILIGGRPRSAPYGLFLALTLLTYLCWGLFAWEITPPVTEWSRKWNRWKNLLVQAAGRLSIGEIWTIVFIPFYLIYIWVIWARVAGTIFFDRYPIPLLPGVILGSLYLLQRRNASSAAAPARFPKIAWVTVAIFALYGVAITHDCYALLRAEARAGDALQKFGIPRNRISAGFEYDATTQTRAVFVMARKAVPDPADPAYKLHWYLPMLPVVQPRYFVVSADAPELRGTTYPQTEYETWLPPFHRQLKIDELEHPAAATTAP